MKEVWKDIIGYSGYYLVSNFGRIKSIIGWNGHKYIDINKILIPNVQKTKNNYKRLKITLTKNKSRKCYSVHRLVAEAFIPNPNEKPEINHIDSNPLNNNINNLEWCTHQENVIHSYKYGLRKPKYDEYAILNDYIVKNILSSNICNIHNISKSILYGILKRNGYKLKSISDGQNKYKIPLEKLLIDLKANISNIDLAKKYNTNRQLIGVYKHKFKKEGLL